jgi:hypothetical protein
VDYHDVPNSYRAIAEYTATASSRVVTGYITTAAYSGEISKTVTGDAVYTAYFVGVEINPTPKPTQTPNPPPSQKPTPTPLPTNTPDPKQTPEPYEPVSNPLPLAPIIISAIILAALAGAGTYFFLRRNVKIYRDSFGVLVAKDKIGANSKTINLTPLEGSSFGIEIDKFTAKALNGQTVEVRHGATILKHKIAFEGNVYRMEADFGAGAIQAIH